MSQTSKIVAYFNICVHTMSNNPPVFFGRSNCNAGQCDPSYTLGVGIPKITENKK